jgi:hypothetical protein
VLRALRLSSVVVLLLLVAGCGGATKHSASNTRSAATASTTQSNAASSNEFARVVSDCEQLGGSALLPGSGGQDASALPDNTPAVCGCWTQWMASNLSSTDQTAVVTSVDESASLTSATLTDIPLLGELGSALSSCDLGQTPPPIGNGSSTSSSPGSEPSTATQTTPGSGASTSSQGSSEPTTTSAPPPSSAGNANSPFTPDAPTNGSSAGG